MDEPEAPATSQKRKLFDDSDDSAAEYEIDLVPQVEEAKEAAPTAVYGTQTQHKKTAPATAKADEQQEDNNKLMSFILAQSSLGFWPPLHKQKVLAFVSEDDQHRHKDILNNKTALTLLALRILKTVFPK